MCNVKSNSVNVLVVAAPEWESANVPTEWVDRYGKRVDDARLPEKAKDRDAYAQMIGKDGATLLDALWSELAPEVDAL